MIKWAEAGLLVAMGLHLLACSKAAPPKNSTETAQPAARPVPANPVARTEAPAAEATATTPATAGNGRGVKTEMHNVLFHLTEDASAHLETLSGEIWPVGKFEMPTLGDKTSFEVRVARGKVSITPEALSSIMNEYVFAAKDAPLKDLSVTIDNGRLKIKGKMHTKGDIPFETTVQVSVTPDGRLRVHTEKVKAMHVPVKGMMGVLGIELASVLNTSKIDGLDTEKNDLLMNLGQLLPPPHIRGKVTGVKVERNAIVTLFGDGEKSPSASKETGNYMIFRGNSVRFGKLTMENADITVVDLDPGDPLDWNQDHYKDQLVAGYSKITPSFGLRAYVKDFAKLSRSSSSGNSPVPTN